LQTSCIELLQAELPKAVVVAPDAPVAAPVAALQILKDLYENHNTSCQSREVVEPGPKTKS
jgi:hypothetical protein